MSSYKVLFLLPFLMAIIIQPVVSISSSEMEMGDCQIDPEIQTEIQNMKPVVEKIIEAIMNGSFAGTTYTDLETFVDHHGARMVGSEALERSIDFMMKRMEEVGFEDVKHEDVIAPKWVRGEESVTMLEPYKKTIPVLGLALCVETPAEGITGEVIVVNSFDDLKTRIQDASGKIIVFNQEFEDPEKAIQYRQLGGIEAAKVSAIGALVRSYTTFSLATPHTGLMFYDEEHAKIPTGEITIEDAQLLHRLYKKGEKITINMKLRNEHGGNITSRNTIGDYKGKTKPEEFVLISGHIDSWDVGQGALDDGYGVVLSVKAVEVLKSLDLVPSRSIRTVLWTAEEIGKIPLGALQYLETHSEELEKMTTMVLEADSGIFNAHGLLFNGSKNAGCILGEILRFLEPHVIEKTKMYPFPELKTDIVPLMKQTGVPGGLIATDPDKYFWYHHSNSDTMTAINSKDLDVCLTMWTVLSYCLGELSIMLPR